MKRNQIIALVVVIVIVAAGAAAAAMAMGNGNKGHSLVFANGNKDCYEPVWIADQMGYYREFGADIEMLTVSGGGKALEALQSGRADIAGFGSTPLANQLNAGTDDNIVVLGRWMGGKSYSEMALLVKEGKAYDFNYPAGQTGVSVTYFDGTTAAVDMQPLTGSGIVIGMDTTTGYKAAVTSYCKAAGLTLKFDGESGYDTADVKVKHVEFGNQVAALDKGDVDAIMGGSYDLAAYASLNGCILSSPSEDRFPTLVSEATCVLAATKEAYATKYTEIVGVLKAIQKACCYIYGLEYTDGILLDGDSVKTMQAALTDAQRNELFGEGTPASLNGYYYRTDACKRIADFFGAPFTTEVQRLSYDKYIWGIEFELVDMQIVEATYNDSSTGTGTFRTLNSMDYMNYFDGRALYDAMKKTDGTSSWDIRSWYGDAAIYFNTLYNDRYTFSTASDDYSIRYTVEDGVWVLYLTKADGTAYGPASVSVTVNGVPCASDYDDVPSAITVLAPVQGDVVVTAS